MKQALKLTAVAVFIGIISTFFYVYKPHRDIVNEEASVVLNATDFMVQIQNQEDGQSNQYLEQVVALRGEVQEVGEHFVILRPGIYCSIAKKNYNPNTGDAVTVKGRYVGYDDLFEQAKLDECTLNNQ